MMQMSSTTPLAGAAGVFPDPVASRLRRRVLNLMVAAGMTAAGFIPATLATAVPAHAAGLDTAAAEAQLINDINADRASNGLGPLLVNPALSNIARGATLSVCGQTVHGRSQDMIERNYFAHQIPPCGSQVFPVLSAAGITYSSAGENIGWNTNAPQNVSVDQVNSQFMGSPGHRANILGNYNQVGVGAYMAPGTWSGYSGVIMYTEIFTMGPPPAAVAPIAAPRVDNIAVTGTDGQAWALQAGGSYAPLGGNLGGAPAVARFTHTPGGPVHFLYVATGTDHDLWVRADDAGWQRLNAGGPVNCLDNPAVSVIGQVLHVVCQGNDHTLWYANGGIGNGLPAVSGWTPLGGVLASGPAAGQLPGAAGPTFLVVGSDGVVWSRTLVSGWASTGWACVGHPALAGIGSGTAYFACHGTDGQLWYATNRGGGWGGPAPLGGSLADGVGVSLTSAGADFYVEGNDGHVYVTSGNGGWNLVGGTVQYGVGAAA